MESEKEFVPHLRRSLVPVTEKEFVPVMSRRLEKLFAGDCDRVGDRSLRKNLGKAFGIESEKASVTGSEMDAETNV
jgi:hypothetical protein